MTSLTFYSSISRNFVRHMSLESYVFGHRALKKKNLLSPSIRNENTCYFDLLISNLWNAGKFAIERLYHPTLHINMSKNLTLPWENMWFNKMQNPASNCGVNHACS